MQVTEQFLYELWQRMNMNFVLHIEPEMKIRGCAVGLTWRDRSVMQL
jgi:hypothetical protein